jgi:hypothetical protein
MSNLRINTSVDEQRLEQLLARQAAIQADHAAIQAEIAILATASAPPTASYQYHRSPIHKQHSQRRSNASRSMSSSGATSMVRQFSSVGSLWRATCTRSNDL